MSELSEIIKYEKQIEQRVAEEKAKADKEIAATKQAVEKELQKASFLTTAEREEIEKEKIKKIGQAEALYQKKLSISLAMLRQKTNEKLGQAVNKVINVLWP